MCVFVTEYDHTGVLSYCYVDYTYLEDYGTAKSMVIHVETIVYHVTEVQNCTDSTLLDGLKEFAVNKLRHTNATL